MSLQLQWGFVEIAKCFRCDSYEELWTHSGKTSESSPLCTGCIEEQLQEAIHRAEYEIANNGTANVAEHEEILVALKHLHLNSPYSSDEYGQRIDVCEACFSGLRDPISNPFVESLMRDGSLARVHERCAHTCESCNESFMRPVPLNWRLAQRLPIRRNWGVPLEYFVPASGFFCTACINNAMEQEGRENFGQCNNCEQYDYSANFRWFNDDTYCETCFDDNVYECDACCESYWADNGHDCSYDEDDDYSIIHNYDYRPRAIFFGHQESKYYLGFELEVEAVHESRSEGALLAQNELGEHAYMKSDGSLNDGFEIVTHPHTLEAYKELNWSALDKLRAKGYRSWNTETCGLHVHVSRTAFGNGDRRNSRQFILSRQMHELRFMKLVYDNQRQVERLAGRPSNHYASFMDKGKLVQKVKHGSQQNGRYSVINTDNQDTLEVRIFRGSLKKETVMSALEFVTASVEYTRNLKVTSTNKALTWARFVAYVVNNADTYPNLLDKMNRSFENDYINADESYA